MKKSSLDRIALVAFATLAMTSADRAAAESTDARRIEELEKENAAMRARLRRLEAESENAGLRTKIERQEARRHAAPPEQANPPAAAPRLLAGAPDRTLILADMPLKAAPAIAPRLYSWTGFYIGANIGYGLGDDPVRSVSTSPGSVFTTYGDPANIAPAGVIGGVQLGYNWQAGPNWLFGVEADFQGSGQRGVTCIIACTDEGGRDTTNDTLRTSSQKIDYFGTVRGRVGMISHGALLYVTGGGAYGRVEQLDAGAFGVTNGLGTFAGATRQNKSGYVVGGGAEAALGGNWTAKIEYLYMDLGSIGVNSFYPGQLQGNPTTPPITLTTESRIRDHIFRVGVNYRVGGDPAPMSAYASMVAIPGPAAPVYSWTGLYGGANVGGIVGNNRVSQVATFPGTAVVPIISSESTNIVPKGVLGGVQAGFNWQFGQRWLAGVEADVQGTNQLQRSCAPFPCIRTTGPVTSQNLSRAEHQLDYFATLRGRIGAINDNVLYYLTGGVAFAHFNQTVSVDNDAPVKSSTAADLTGYVVGGGIEAAIGGGWTAKVEYLFMDLGSVTTTFDRGVNPAFPLIFSTTTTVRDHIMRIGTNYRF